MEKKIISVHITCNVLCFLLVRVYKDKLLQYLISFLLLCFLEWLCVSQHPGVYTESVRITVHMQVIHIDILRQFLHLNEHISNMFVMFSLNNEFLSQSIWRT